MRFTARSSPRIQAFVWLWPIACRVDGTLYPMQCRLRLFWFTSSGPHPSCCSLCFPVLSESPKSYSDWPGWRYRSISVSSTWGRQSEPLALGRQEGHCEFRPAWDTQQDLSQKQTKIAVRKKKLNYSTIQVIISWPALAWLLQPILERRMLKPVTIIADLPVSPWSSCVFFDSCVLRFCVYAQNI